jgi:hypothetical protein
MKNVFNIMIIVGVCMMVGAVGSSEIDVISYSEMIKYALIGGLIYGIGYTGNRVRV